MCRLLPQRWVILKQDAPSSAGEAAMHAKKKGSTEELAVVGIDIGKETFHLVGFDRSGQLVMRKQIKRLARSAAWASNRGLFRRST
jgi:hypothetical protein